MSMLKNLGSKISNAGQDVAKKTKDIAEITKINSQINNEESKIKNLYGEIGKVYFELYSDTQDEKLHPLCAAIAESKDNIKAYQEKIETIKGIRRCPQCGAEVAENAAFCGSCGFNVGVVVKEEKVEPVGKVCSNCGIDLGENAVFCMGCGTKV